MDNVAAIAARIKIARDRAELTQTQLGDALGVTREMISLYEGNGPGVQDYLVGKLRLIARETNTDPCWLAFGVASGEGAGFSAGALRAVLEEVMRYLQRRGTPLSAARTAAVVEWCYANLRERNKVERQKIRDLLKSMPS